MASLAVCWHAAQLSCNDQHSLDATESSAIVEEDKKGFERLHVRKVNEKHDANPLSAQTRGDLSPWLGNALLCEKKSDTAIDVNCNASMRAPWSNQ